MQRISGYHFHCNPHTKKAALLVLARASESGAISGCMDGTATRTDVDAAFSHATDLHLYFPPHSSLSGYQ